MEIPILNTIGILLGLAVVVLLVFRRFKLPTIIGFLITGILVGPSGLGLVAQSHDIEVMAELGIILLLFIIGMEFSLKSLMSIKKAVLLGGSIQVGLTNSFLFAGIQIRGGSIYWLFDGLKFHGYCIKISSGSWGNRNSSWKNCVGYPHFSGYYCCPDDVGYTIDSRRE